MLAFYFFIFQRLKSKINALNVVRKEKQKVQVIYIVIGPWILINYKTNI
jgi:hypothetical protein